MAISVLCCWYCWQMLPLHTLVPSFVNTFSSFYQIFSCVLYNKYNFASSRYLREPNSINYRVIDCLIPENSRTQAEHKEVCLSVLYFQIVCHHHLNFCHASFQQHRHQVLKNEIDLGIICM